VELITHSPAGFRPGKSENGPATHDSPGAPCGLRMLKLALKLLAVAFILFSGASAHAKLACNISNGNNLLNAGYLSVPRDAAIGQVTQTLPPQSFIMDCTFDARAPAVTASTLTSEFKTTVAPVSGTVDVYPTNISGLGVRYTVSADQCTEKNVVIQNQHAVLNCPLSGAVGEKTPVPSTIKTEFIVTGPLGAGALTLASVPRVDVTYTVSTEAGAWVQTPVYSGSASGTIRQQSCSVQNSAIPVTLPTVSTRSLGSDTGATAGSQEFSLDLTCTAGAQVSVTFTDATNPANTSNVLSLASGSTATGVGIELRRSNDMKISYGPDSAAPGTTNQWLVGAAPNGNLKIPLSARYVRTAGALAAGSVKALATFTMSYN